MSLRESIVPYVDGNGLVAPSLFPPGTQRASDNGPLFTAIYHLLLHNTQETIPGDETVFRNLVSQCIRSDLELHRAPGDSSPDEIDDYLGVLAVLNLYGLKVEFKLPLRLCRFPQLVYVYLLNTGKLRLLVPPLGVLTALIIAISCWNTEVANSNDRQLNWVLIQATQSSWLCRMSANIWYWRQSKIYNTTNFMQLVVILYYQSKHPFITLWKDSR